MKKVLLKILIVLVFGLSYIYTIGADTQIKQIDIVENPKSKVTKIMADRNRDGAKLNLTVRKLIVQELELAPIIERVGEDKYLTFDLPYVEGDYEYFVTDDKRFIPRNHKVNGKIVKNLLFKDIMPTTPKVLNFIIEKKVEDENKKLVDYVKIKADEKITGEYIYIVRMDSKLQEPIKIFSYKLPKDRVSTGTFTLGWKNGKILSRTESIPNPLKNWKGNDLNEYTFHNRKYIYLGSIKKEDTSDREVKFMATLIDNDILKALGISGRIYYIASSRGGLDIINNYNNQVLLNTYGYSLFNIAVDWVGDLSTYLSDGNSVQRVDAAGNVVTSSNLGVERDGSRDLKMLEFLAARFKRETGVNQIWGTNPNTQVYKIVKIDLKNVPNLKAGLYILDLEQMGSVVSIINQNMDYVVGSNQLTPDLYTVINEKPGYIGAFLITRDNINGDIIKLKEESLVDNKIKLTELINPQKPEAGYDDSFYSKLMRTNDIGFTLTSDKPGNTMNTLVVPTGIVRGLYELDICPGIPNDTMDDIMSKPSIPKLYLVDTNEHNDWFKIKYEPKVTTIDMEANFSQVPMGTWISWKPEVINTTAENTDIPLYRFGTTTVQPKYSLKKITGEIFDSRWKNRTDNITMGATLTVTDNGVPCNIIIDPVSNKQKAEILNSKGEVVAYVGLEGHDGSPTGGDIGTFFINKLNRDYKEHNIVMTATDPLGDEIGTINLKLNLDVVEDIGYVGAGVIKEMLEVAQAEGKSWYYFKNVTLAGRKSGTMGDNTTDSVNSPGMTNIYLDLPDGMDITTLGIRYNKALRVYEYTAGTKFKTLNLWNIRTMEVENGKENSFMDNNTVAQNKLEYYLQNVAIDMKGVTSCGELRADEAVTLIVQAKRNGVSYPAGDNGEFYRIGILPMVTRGFPKTSEVVLDTRTPNYPINSIKYNTPYQYKIVNAPTAYNLDMGFEGRNDALKLRAPLEEDLIPNGNVPIRSSPYDYVKLFDINLDITQNGVTTNVPYYFTDSKGRYYLQLGEDTFLSLGARYAYMYIYFKTDDMVDDELKIVTKATVPGLSSPVPLGTTIFKIKAGQVLKGSGNIDLTYVREGDLLRWRGAMYSETINTVVNGNSRSYRRVDITSPSGVFFPGKTSLFKSLLGVNKMEVITPDGSIYTGLRTPENTIDIDTPDLSFGLKNLDSSIYYELNTTKNVFKATAGAYTVNVYNDENGMIGTYTFNVTDNSEIKEGYRENYVVSRIYKYYAPTGTEKIEYLRLRNRGNLYVSDGAGGYKSLRSTNYTNIVQPNSTKWPIVIGNTNTHISDFIGVKGYENIGSYEFPEATGHYGYVDPTTKEVQGTVIAAANLEGLAIQRQPITDNILKLDSLKETSPGRLESEPKELIWRTPNNVLISGTLTMALTEDYGTDGSGTIDLHDLLTGQEYKWRVKNPQEKITTDMSLVFDKTLPAQLTSTTGYFMPTGVDSIWSLVYPVTGVANIGDKLTVKKYMQLDDGTYETTPLEIEILPTDQYLMTSGTELGDIEIGIRNGEFYIKKLESKIKPCKLELDLDSTNGKIGHYVLTVKDTKYITEVIGYNYSIHSYLRKLVALDTPNVKWIGTDGKLYVDPTGTAYPVQYKDYVEMTTSSTTGTALPWYKSLVISHIEKIDQANPQDIEILTPMGNGMYGKDGVAEIHWQHNPTISMPSQLKIETFKLKVTDEKKTYVVVLKNQYLDEYKLPIKIYDKGLGFSNDLYMVFEDIIGNSMAIDDVISFSKLNDTNPALNDTPNYSISKDDSGVYSVKTKGGSATLRTLKWGIDGINTARKMKIYYTDHFTGQSKIETFIGDKNTVTGHTDFIDITITNGVLSIKKIRSIFSVAQYTVQLLGDKDEPVGNIYINHSSETPKNISSILQIDDKLLEYGINNGFDTIFNNGIMNKTTNVKKDVPAMIGFVSPSGDNSLAPVRELIDMYTTTAGNVKLDRGQDLGDYINYGDKVYIPKDTSTFNHADMFLKASIFDLSTSKMQEENIKPYNLKQMPYILRYTGTDKKLYRLTMMINSKHIKRTGDGNVDMTPLNISEPAQFLAGQQTVSSKLYSTNRKTELNGTEIRLINRQFVNLTTDKREILNRISVNGVLQSGLQYTSPLVALDFTQNSANDLNYMTVFKNSDEIFYEDITITGYHDDIPLDTFVLSVRNRKPLSGKGVVDFTQLADNTQVQWLPDNAPNQQTPSKTGNTPIQWDSATDRLLYSEYKGKSIVAKINLELQYEDLLGNPIGAPITKESTTTADGVFVTDNKNQVRAGFTNDGIFTMDRLTVSTGENIRLKMEVLDQYDGLVGNLEILVKLTDTVIGSTTVDMTNARIKDSISWGMNKTVSAELRKTFNYDNTVAGRVNAIFPGIAYENTVGDMYNLSPLFISVAGIAKTEVTYNGQTLSNASSYVATPEVNVYLATRTITLIKNVEKLPAGDLVVKAYNKDGDVVVQNTFHIKDDSVVEVLADDTITLYKNYKYVIPCSFGTLSFLSSDGAMYYSESYIGRLPQLRVTSKQFDITGVKSPMISSDTVDMYLDSSNPTLSGRGKLFEYGVGKLVKFTANPVYMNISGTAESDTKTTISPMVVNLTSKLEPIMTGKKAEFDLDSVEFDWLTKSNRARKSKLKFKLVDYRSYGEGSIDLHGKLVGERISWKVNPPQINGADLVFEPATNITALSNTSGEFFPTVVDKTNSLYPSLTGPTNIPNVLYIKRYDKDSNGGYATTPNKNISASYTNPTTLKTRLLGDLEIGIENGEFYLEKITPKVKPGKYEITARNSNGELGTFIIYLDDTTTTVDMGESTLSVYNNLNTRIASNTTASSWIGTDGKIYPDGVSLEVGNYPEYVDFDTTGINFLPGEYTLSSVAKVYADQPNTVIQLGSAYKNEINFTPNPTITQLADLNLDSMRIKTDLKDRKYIITLKDKYQDEYNITINITTKNNINIGGGTGIVSLANVGTTAGKNVLSWDISGKSDMEILANDNLSPMTLTGRAPYININKKNLPIKMKVKDENGQEVSNVVGNISTVKANLENVTIELANGELKLYKLKSSLIDQKYSLELIGDDDTIMGTFDLIIEAEEPVRIMATMAIDNRLLENEDTTKLQVGVNQIIDLTTNTISQGQGMTFTAGESMSAVSKLVGVFEEENIIQGELVPMGQLGTYTNYGNTVYLPTSLAGITNTKTLIDKAYFERSKLAMSAQDKVVGSKTKKYNMLYQGIDGIYYKVVFEISTKNYLETGDGKVDLSSQTVGTELAFEQQEGVRNEISIMSTPPGVEMTGKAITLIKDSFNSGNVLTSIEVNGTKMTGLVYSTPDYTINLTNPSYTTTNSIKITKKSQNTFKETLIITGYSKDIKLDTFELIIKNIEPVNGEGTINMYEKANGTVTQWKPDGATGQKTPSLDNTLDILWKTPADKLMTTSNSMGTIIGQMTGKVWYTDYNDNIVGVEKNFDIKNSTTKEYFTQDTLGDLEFGFDKNGIFTVKKINLSEAHNINTEINLYDEEGSYLGTLKLRFNMLNLVDLGTQTLELDRRLVDKYGKINGILYKNRINNKTNDLYTVSKFINYSTGIQLDTDMKKAQLLVVENRDVLSNTSTTHQGLGILNGLDTKLTTQDIAMEVPKSLLYLTTQELVQDIKLNLGELMLQGDTTRNTDVETRILYISLDTGNIYIINYKVAMKGYVNGVSQGYVDLSSIEKDNNVVFEYNDLTNAPQQAITGVVMNSPTLITVKLEGIPDSVTGEYNLRLPRVSSYVNGEDETMANQGVYVGKGYTLEFIAPSNLKITKTEYLIDNEMGTYQLISDLGGGETLILDTLELKVNSKGVVIDDSVNKGYLDFGQLLYDNRGDLHYGETQIDVKGLPNSKKIRFDIKQKDIILAGVGSATLNVKGMEVKEITPMSTTDGKASFMISGNAEVKKTTNTGKYSGAVTVDVYISD